MNNNDNTDNDDNTCVSMYDDMCIHVYIYIYI